MQLRGLGIDGLLRLDSLDDDEYVMEANGQAWFAKRRKQRLGIGCPVRVIVTNANPVEGLIDLELDAPVPAIEGKTRRTPPHSPRQGARHRRRPR